MKRTTGDRGQPWPYASRSQPLLWLWTICLLVETGCSVVEQTAKLPVKAVASVVPGTESKQPGPAILQTELQRYADDFSGQTSVALNEYARRVNTPEAHTEALKWKITLGSSALSIATGPNPTANLLDFLALATLTRTFAQQQMSQRGLQAAFTPLFDASQLLETNAWQLAVGVLTTNQQNEYRFAITKWCEQNTISAASFFARPQDFSAAIRESVPQQSQPGSVFSLIGLDPTAGLDPAVREVTLTRLFAERALFAIERMPFFVRWQVELLSDELLNQQQVANTLASVDRISRAAESISQSAAVLPDRITEERKAILTALDSQEGRLRALSEEVTRSLNAGEKMSTSLNTTITTFDALMKRFGVGEPSTSPPDTNSPPFNVLDYAQTANQIGAMAQELDALIKDANNTVATPALDAKLNAISGRASADAKSVLNHAFLLAAGLIVLGFACALIYRRLTPRNPIEPKSRTASGTNP